LARFRDAYAGFVSRGAEILAVGPDALEPFQRYWARENIPFIGMPDPDHRVAKMYRQEINLFKFGRMPMNCVIDTRGNIRYIHYSASRSDYPDTDIFFNVIDELNKTSK
jgi:peroxiredoxin Q/BCP